MTPEIGHFALALALAMALVQSVLPILGAGRGNILWMQSARWSSFGQVFFVGIAFLALMQAFVTSDFTVKNVVEKTGQKCCGVRTSRVELFEVKVVVK